MDRPPQTPGTRIPSHGTDALGERYAYDFVGIDAHSRSRRFYRASVLRYLIFGVPLQACYGWGQPVYAATDGWWYRRRMAGRSATPSTSPEISM